MLDKIGAISSVVLAASIGMRADILNNTSTNIMLVIAIVWSAGALGFILGRIADGVNED